MSSQVPVGQDLSSKNVPSLLFCISVRMRIGNSQPINMLIACYTLGTFYWRSERILVSNQMDRVDDFDDMVCTKQRSNAV
jgi:hypothetical protein